VNPVKSLLANGTPAVGYCRPQNHQDPVPALNLQLIQYNLAAIGQQCPLLHSKLRGITGACPSSATVPLRRQSADTGSTNVRKDPFYSVTSRR
jgi:hypothetical protein